MKCCFKIWSKNLTVHMKWHESAGLEVGNQTDTTALAENCTDLTSPDKQAANTGICPCVVVITRMNLTDTGNGTQGTVPSKWHCFCFHGGDERAEKDAMTNAPPSTPMRHFPPKASRTLERPAQHGPLGRCIPPRSCLAVGSLK